MNDPQKIRRVHRPSSVMDRALRPGEVELSKTDRRRFLQLLGASLALAGEGGCRMSQPRETIVPYVRSPEHVVPGKPLHYATSVTLGGYATGVLVESHLGRPTKIEGNPQHPASLGGTDAQTQAAILSLYDPDRSQVITHRGEIQTWKAFVGDAQIWLDQQNSKQGSGLRVLTETFTSPTLQSQRHELLQQYPKARWHRYQPVQRSNVYRGSELAFGDKLEPHPHLAKAERIVSLDADFLAQGPGHVRHARDFADRRDRYGAHQDDASSSMNRLYVAESNYTITGAAADHRLAMRSSQIEAATVYLAQQLEVDAAVGIAVDDSLSQEAKTWLDAAAEDLLAHRGSGIVLTGDHQPPAVHALAHAIDAHLDNLGSTVTFSKPVAASESDGIGSLQELVDDMQSGAVDLLVILGGNPVYNAPADVPFAEALQKVSHTVHLALYEDETSRRCRWHLPAAHELETWSDARAMDGSATILQPLIEPLHGGRTAHEIVAVLLGQTDPSSHDIVKDYWQQRYEGDDFSRYWRRSLHDGVVPDSQFASAEVTLSLDPDLPLGPAIVDQDGRIELLLQADPRIDDGRFANNAWLQELPRPITTLTWDNAALMSPATARRFGLASEQLVEIEHEGRTVTLPALIVPGHADDCLTAYFGFGRTAGGQLATEPGFNVYPLCTSRAPAIVKGATLQKTDGRHRLARTQSHHGMEDRDPVRTATIGQFQEDPHRGHQHDGQHFAGEALTLYESPQPSREDEYAWGMSIDLTKCIGCSACTIACQAENNIPVVGKEEVLRGREMHWIRVDEYVEKTPAGPRSLHQPVPCMHCENAPCEVVCPVAATVHSDEGLNEMVYNRCVGTRYCSNNCPYKVRRFNFLPYTDEQTPVLKLLHNPDVTVRTRGVMEKCTYCVQRINAARIDARKENRRIADGEIVTACQQACPTQAIVFGDTADPDSRVSQTKARPHDYGLLEELNTRPRTTYLARITNPAQHA